MRAQSASHGPAQQLSSPSLSGDDQLRAANYEETRLGQGSTQNDGMRVFAEDHVGSPTFPKGLPHFNGNRWFGPTGGPPKRFRIQISEGEMTARKPRTEDEEKKDRPVCDFSLFCDLAELCSAVQEGRPDRRNPG